MEAKFEALVKAAVSVLPEDRGHPDRLEPLCELLGARPTL